MRLKKVFLFSSICLGALVVFLFINTLRFQTRQLHFAPIKHVESTNSSIIRLSKAIQYQTISNQENKRIDTNEFYNFHTFLKHYFPFIDSALLLKKINRLSLLYEWKGSDPTLRPILLMAHQDVVPVEAITLSDWSHPPFQGAIKKGFIYGRGTLDVKSGITAQMEAIEYLIAHNYKPKRTIFLAYGHDEEVGGKQGALRIAEYLRLKKVQLKFVLDEGGSIIKGIVPGIRKPIAIIGVAEKGYLSLELTAKEKGGHSSMPPKESAIGILSSAIKNLENYVFPSRMSGVGSIMFDYISPEMNFGLRFAIANKWLFSSFIEQKLDMNNATRATLHTTMATTVFKAGEKENVLPTKAKAIINFRIMPGETISQVIERVKEIIDDPRIHIKTNGKFNYEPSIVSNPSSPTFRLMQKTAKQVFPDLIVAPYLVLGSTDSRHYKNLTKNIYRFVPFRLEPSDLNRIHGINERISIKTYKEGINFYIQLIRNSTK
jgi:carboxypeptidase PM20D1